MSKNGAEVIDPYFETDLINLMYSLEKRSVMDFEVAVIEKMADSISDPSFEEAVCRIDALCGAVDINPDAWIKNWFNGRTDGRSIDSGTAENRQREGASVGSFVTEIAWHRLPIEDNCDGSGFVVVDLNVEHGRILRIRGDSTLWVTYPGLDEPDGAESSMAYTMKFLASIGTANEVQSL